jgi:surface antigen
MPTDPHNCLSTYLVKPNLTRRYSNQWGGFRSRVSRLGQTNPRIASRLVAALAVWCCFFASVTYIVSPKSFVSASAISNAGPILSQTATIANTAPVYLTKTVATQTLANGPSGQLLPPIYMAPDDTYPNSYDWGQCTWYVAGRRQVPPHWGNADQWYGHAMASGWGVGTTPTIGAIAWTSAGYYGHVALVEQVSTNGDEVYVSEKNYRGLDVKDFRWAATSSFKYIY